MKDRLPIILSTAALGIAVLGVTPAGEAARNVLVPRNSVGTAQLRNGAVVSSKVRNGSLRAVDFVRGKLPQGPVGPAGPAGPQGAPGMSGRQAVFATTVNDSTSFKSTSAACPPGKQVLGGGAAVAPSSAAVPVAITTNYINGTTWTASARETASYGGSWNLNVAAICATVAG